MGEREGEIGEVRGSPPLQCYGDHWLEVVSLLLTAEEMNTIAGELASWR